MGRSPDDKMRRIGEAIARPTEPFAHILTALDHRWGAVLICFTRDGCRISVQSVTQVNVEDGDW